MRHALAQRRRHFGQGQRKQERDQVVERQGQPRELHPFCVLRTRWSGFKHIHRHSRAVVKPHQEQARPREKLNQRHAFHDRRHVRDAMPHLLGHLGNALAFLHGGQLLFGGWMWLGLEDRPKHGAQKSHCAQVERPFDGGRDAACFRVVHHTKHIPEQPRQRGGHNRPHPNHEALHGEAFAVLLFWQHVHHKCTEGLHTHVDACVQDPEQACRHPQCGGIGHEHQRNAAQDGPHQKEGLPPPQPRPGLVTPSPNKGLHNQAGQRRGEPQHGDLLRLGAEVLVNGTHVGHLQSPSKLDAHEPKTHVPDFPETQIPFFHRVGVLM